MASVRSGVVKILCIVASCAPWHLAHRGILRTVATICPSLRNCPPFLVLSDGRACFLHSIVNLSNCVVTSDCLDTTERSLRRMSHIEFPENSILKQGSVCPARLVCELCPATRFSKPKLFPSNFLPGDKYDGSM